jgi:poly(hydroxyalkanoate) depolymerase family esterase
MVLPVSASAAALTQVNRSDWAGGVNLPSYVSMYIYVPDKLAAKPPIMVSSHSCGSSATGQMGNIPKIKAAADANGFILILPDNPGQNCWDVGSAASLKHDGGGDTQAVAQMVKYTLTKYNGDPARVYAMGGSSGAMMTQALMAVYPDVFRAGSARAGVPAGCWADGYASSNQWSNNCAGGNTTKTAQQWGDLVRGMDPGYTGHRPRLQIMQGEADTTISYKNTAESIKEWTNVLGLSTAPSSTDTGYKAANATYDRQFWKNACGYVVFEAWSSPGGTHSMPYEEADILKYFGLDTAGGSDPEPDCSGDGGAGGSGGGNTTGSGGSNGVTGSSGAGGGSGGRSDGGMGAGPSGTGGTRGTTGGSGTSGGTVGTGGTVGSGGGAVGTGGAAGSSGTTGGVGTSGETGTVGTSSTGASGGTIAGGDRSGSSAGGVQGSGGAGTMGGSTGSSTGTAGMDDGSSANGCSFALGGGERSPRTPAVLLLAAVALIRRRRKRLCGSLHSL